MVSARGWCVEDSSSGSRLTSSEMLSSYIMVGVFDFPLLRAEKRDKIWLIPLAVADVVVILVLLSPDLVFNLVCKPEFNLVVVWGVQYFQASFCSSLG